MEETDAGQEGSRAGERRMSNEDVADTKEDRMSDAAMISKTGGRRQSGDYAALQNVLDEAFLQSAEGKGNARHANDKPFDKQPILEIGRMVGPGFAAGQIMKKAQEAIGMAARGETEAAANELLGAIVYAASAVVLVREKPVAVEADASRLIEPEVAPRPFKVGDKVRHRRIPEAGLGEIIEKAHAGNFVVRYDSGGYGYCTDPVETLVHVD